MRSPAWIVGIVVLAAAAGARAEPPPAPPLEWHADGEAVVRAEHGGSGTVLGASSTAALSLGPAASRLTVSGSVDVHRTPGLGARRELTAAPFSSGVLALDFAGGMGPGEPLPWGAAALGFPMAMFGGVTWQDGRRRGVGGLRSTALQMCWPPDRDGEATCVGLFGGGVTSIRDGALRYAAVSGWLLPVEGARLGPARLDVTLGFGTISRSLVAMPEPPPELAVTALQWDVRLRGRAGELDLVLATRREPFAALDGALSFEDRAELVAAGAVDRVRWTATVHVARTRWWMGEAASRADTLGGELALRAPLAGFELGLRAGVGRSFYATLDDTLAGLPALGARVHLELIRSLTLR